MMHEWPVLTSYDQNHLARIALPLGGIGTGTVSLGGRGNLRDWEIMNRPAKHFVPGIEKRSAPFFAIFTKQSDGTRDTRALEGPLELAEYEGAMGCPSANHGLPRFRQCSFDAAYPFGQVRLADPEMPVRVCLQAFNPLIPPDADASGIPVAILRYNVTNLTDAPLEAAICATIPNFIGIDGSETARDWQGGPQARGACQNRNSFRQGQQAQGIFMDSQGVAQDSPAWGSMAIATAATETTVSHRTAWAELSWGDSVLDFWDDFSDDGMLDERPAGKDDSPTASLAVGQTIPPGKTQSVTFLITWHFPNRYNWAPKPATDACCGGASKLRPEDRIGNYYTDQYADAWEVAEALIPRLDDLEARTVQFVAALCDTSLPAVVKEAALYNLSTLRSQTCFRTPDGRFYGWEGCCDGGGCCFGSCTHVWNYEQATAFLFGDLALSMREVEFGHATRDDGLMSFRVQLPIARGGEFGTAAADGQMGCIMKMYRDWQLSGDTDFLRTHWAAVRRALAFCWVEGGWDADRDGVMEGCQHNTMDVEYYGPNPQMQVWYLGALRAAEEMARHLGDTDFAKTCRDLFEKGSAWTDANLFNGQYYEHQVRAPGKDATIREGLKAGMGADDLVDPPLQLGAGCLVDQLVGQYMAHICGLGYLTDADNVKTTLDSIYTHNRKVGFHSHFNHFRSFVLGDESALLMASYPLGRRPKRPFPYYNEVMTGFEYTAAVHMLYEGQETAGLQCIDDIRSRYDGRKRSPFNEAECGHHYARAMASWAAIPALTGFHYSGVDASLRLGAREGTWFWSTGHAWGTCDLQEGATGWAVTLNVVAGSLRLSHLELGGIGSVDLGDGKVLEAGDSVTDTI